MCTSRIYPARTGLPRRGGGNGVGSSRSVTRSLPRRWAGGSGRASRRRGRRSRGPRTRSRSPGRACRRTAERIRAAATGEPTAPWPGRFAATPGTPGPGWTGGSYTAGNRPGSHRRGVLAVARQRQPHGVIFRPLRHAVTSGRTVPAEARLDQTADFHVRFVSRHRVTGAGEGMETQFALGEFQMRKSVRRLTVKIRL